MYTRYIRVINLVNLFYFISLSFASISIIFTISIRNCIVIIIIKSISKSILNPYYHHIMAQDSPAQIRRELFEIPKLGRIKHKNRDELRLLFAEVDFIAQGLRRRADHLGLSMGLTVDNQVNQARAKIVKVWNSKCDDKLCEDFGCRSNGPIKKLNSCYFCVPHCHERRAFPCGLPNCGNFTLCLKIQLFYAVMNAFGQVLNLNLHILM